MISKSIRIRLRWLLWRFEWLMLITVVGIIGIDIWIYNYFITGGSTLDDRLRVLAALAPLTSVIIAAIGISYQVEATNRREVKFKIHQQRKEVYEELSNLIKRIFDHVKAQGDKGKAKSIMDSMQEDWMNVQFDVIIYSSPKVLDIYSQIRDPENSKRGAEWMNGKLAELFFQMRSEVSFKGDDIPHRKLLGLFINDVFDHKYDSMFDKDGYLINPEKPSISIASVTRGITSWRKAS